MENICHAMSHEGRVGLIVESRKIIQLVLYLHTTVPKEKSPTSRMRGFSPEIEKTAGQLGPSERSRETR